MEKTVTIKLLENAVLLLALSVVYEITYLLPYKRFRIKSILNGLLISLICFAVMAFLSLSKIQLYSIQEAFL